MNSIQKRIDLENLIARITGRASIRRKIPRGEPDRISNELEEAAKFLKEYLEIIPKLEK